jgi:hypothetical protein
MIAAFWHTNSYGLENISQKDQRVLEFFFSFLIRNTAMGYSLCGDKPIAIETLPNISRIPSCYSVNIFFKQSGYSVLWEGWKVWSYYADRFSSHNFVFRFNRQNNTLVLINKRETKKIIECNLKIFQTIFSDVLSVDEILQRICYPEDHDYLFNQREFWISTLYFKPSQARSLKNSVFIQSCINY